MSFFFFFFQAEDGIRDLTVTGVQTCALPIWVEHGLHVLPGIEAHVAHEGVEKDEGRDRIAHGHCAPLEVADRAHLLGPYQLEAADVASGQEHERRARVKLDQEGPDEIHREVGPAGGQASRYSYPSPF